VALHPAGLDQRTTAALLADAKAACETFAMPAMGPGLLLVERRLARHLVGVLLGLPMPAVVAPLSRIERGMLGGLAAGALAKLGLACAIQVASTQTDQIAPDAVALDVWAKVGGETGQVLLCATPAALVRCWEGALLSSGSTPAVLQLELARTNLPRSEAPGASEGDIVVFDETPALSSSSSWPVQLHYRGRQASAALGPDGRVYAGDQTAATPLATIARRPSMTAGGDAEITAEIAHAAATDSPARGPAGSARGDGILLRMDETDWAEGALCEVAGRLAVRITRTLAG
jgi:hypothetical protein